MIIQEIKVLKGPNFWSVKKHHLIQMLLDIEELEHRPTDTIPGFYDRLRMLLPSMYAHQCSEGVPGGFFERVRRGTWMGHVVEHIAIELQTLAGMEVGFGRARGTGKEGVYHVVFEYTHEAAGRYAATASVALAQDLIEGHDINLEGLLKTLRQLASEGQMGPSTKSLVDEARRRGIPVLRLDDDSLIQLGYGSRQQRIEATIAGTTSQIAVDIAGNKNATKQLLTAANIPVPQGWVVNSVENLEEAINNIGFPIVIKPLDGNHGNGATINVQDVDSARKAFRRAQQYSEKVIAERYCTGEDFRALVINYKFVAAALRTPAHVIGDGIHTIAQLVEIVNSDPRRGFCHSNMLTRIDIDEVSLELLQQQGYGPDTVLLKDTICYLKPTANLSTGGTATDVTDEVHPDNKRLFERVARTVGLDICGIDVIAGTLQTPLAENGGVVIEVNAAPGFRMHLQPTFGQPRNVAAPVIDMLFQDGNGRIPLVAITGTNGKTTTTRLLAQMTKAAGLHTGFTTTDGVYINDELVMTGDCSGPQSAQLVLKDPIVEYAVLETARGGILRSGLGFDQCDAAIVTNVAEDHLGLGGIDTIEKLAKVKAVVPETVQQNGYAVLNADDDLVYAMKDRVKCKVALFSLYSDNIRIDEHCSKGGLAAYLEGGYLLLRKGNQILPVEEVQNTPVTFGGRATFNVSNVLAAMLAAYTTNIPVGAIRKALQEFTPSAENTPGRINIFDFPDFRVVLDYAHNPHGVRALGGFIKTMDASTRVGIITGVGDRRDEDITALGEEAAKVFDEIIIRHDDDLRGRTHEELDRLLTVGVHKVDARKPITYFHCECEAVNYAVEQAKPNSLIVVLIENFKAVTACIQKHQQMARRELQQVA
jgi:cyanophycin synthetase